MMRALLLFAGAIFLSACATDRTEQRARDRAALAPTEKPRTLSDKPVSSSSRQRGHTCADQTWRGVFVAKPQTFDVRPDLKIGGRQIRPVVYGPLAGGFGKVYAFYELQGRCVTRALTLGSYERTTQFARSSGHIAPDA